MSDENPCELWVILREIGEYSDRDVTAIRYVLSEDAAKQAVEQAEKEIPLPAPLPYPDYVPSTSEARPQYDEAIREYYAAIEASGRVDPMGAGERYYYEQVTFWPPKAP